MSEVFVSYKRENMAAVDRMVHALRQEGVDVWWDCDLPPDAPWEQTIERELAGANVVVVAWSKAAVSSDNVKAEARWARRHRRLLQVYLEHCEPPLFFGERQGVNLVEWSGATSDPSFRVLLNAIRDSRPTEAAFASKSNDPATARSHAEPPPIAVDPTRDGSWIFPDGTILNGLFEVRRLLGRGGLGAVYEGVNVTTRERVAIKAFRPELGDSAIVRQSLLHEMHLFVQISDPAVVPYRLAAREPTFGALYIVTDFVEGITLDALIGQVTLPEQQLRILTGRLARGLKNAHEVGVLHRGLGPDCIVAPNGRLDQSKIIDFGVSPDFDASRIGTTVAPAQATSRYAAPEQLGDFGGEVGPWTDVYSLGLIMLALATGIEAPRLRDAEERQRASPNLPRAPRRLRALFARMSNPDPEQRIRSMAAVLSALDG